MNKMIEKENKEDTIEAKQFAIQVERTEIIKSEVAIEERRQRIKEMERDITDIEVRKNERKCTCGSGDAWNKCRGIDGDISYCG